MRYHEFINESAAIELADNLPSLKKHDYHTIDKLMHRIGSKHKLTGKKLHDLFVHKYGHTPDVWIKKLKNELAETPEILDELTLAQMRQELATMDKDRTPQRQVYRSPEEYAQAKRKEEKEKYDQMFGPKYKPLEKYVSEEYHDETEMQQIKDFIQWSIKILHVQKPYPIIKLSRDTEQAQKGHRTGMHSPDDNLIWVYIANRNLVDIFRTIFHELVHERQGQLGMIKAGDSYPGSPIEAMADMMAGKYIKIYGKRHPEIFQ